MQKTKRKLVDDKKKKDKFKRAEAPGFLEERAELRVRGTDQKCQGWEQSKHKRVWDCWVIIQRAMECVDNENKWGMMKLGFGSSSVPISAPVVPLKLYYIECDGAMIGHGDEADLCHLIKYFTPSSHLEWGGGSQWLLMKWAYSLYKLVYHALEEKFFYEY